MVSITVPFSATRWTMTVGVSAVVSLGSVSVGCLNRSLTCEELSDCVCLFE